MDIIFESVWLLLTVAGVALVAATIARQAKPEWGYWPLLAPLAIVGLAFAVDAAVQTDTEAIGDLINRGKQAVVAGDMKALMALISPDYADQDRRSKQDIEEQARRHLNLPITKIKTQSHLLSIRDRTADSRLNVVVHFDKSSNAEMLGSILFLGMTIRYEKVGEQWLISSVNDLTVNNEPW